jgi:hypothetical protein
MNPWQQSPPEQRIRELRAEREWHLLALEHIEDAIQRLWERVA